jgi:hypothetical protein
MSRDRTGEPWWNFLEEFDDMIGMNTPTTKWKTYERFTTYPEVTRSCVVKDLGTFCRTGSIRPKAMRRRVVQHRPGPVRLLALPALQLYCPIGSSLPLACFLRHV